MLAWKRVYDKAAPGRRCPVPGGAALAAELESHPGDTRQFAAPPAMLVYSSHYAEHINALALKEYLNARMGKQRTIKHA
jgi:hypothetical protein